MNKRLRKKKLKHSNFIELPLEKLQDIELLESGKLDGEVKRKGITRFFQPNLMGFPAFF